MMMMDDDADDDGEHGLSNKQLLQGPQRGGTVKR